MPPKLMFPDLFYTLYFTSNIDTDTQKEHETNFRVRVGKDLYLCIQVCVEQAVIQPSMTVPT